MYIRTVLTALAFASTVVANVVNLNIYTDSDATDVGNHRAQAVLAQPVEEPPAWKRRDQLHLVPLVPEAGTGVIPVEVEEGLKFALGPRFANEFIRAGLEQANSSADIAPSCSVVGCAGTVIRAMPCVIAAIECKCIDPLLKCPVKPKDLCSCVECFPPFIRDFLHKIGICKSAIWDLPTLPQTAQDEALDYANFIPYSTRDTNLLAFRGDLPKTTLDEAAALAAGGLCPTGPCGSCPCCIGLCVLEQCIGACVDLGGASRAHYEL